ncbi:DmsC/YnfH family molybdoenzyme membrane anchor subunit [Thalassoroseus pseudoceratinae]|uniref:DmsC/YnfH family molybdoenzyme membrane anchor subunit n=1 Tax=Thalassoroseus pseudoceratinae TaxID=2713176 RepID=UPI00141EC9A2|nr:DmsC/YnfH family molybdoenzyme membrane anchor subunit [Thalassoroseus pseudoceratinae]
MNQFLGAENEGDHNRSGPSELDGSATDRHDLLSWLLADQQDMSAVEAFSQVQSSGQTGDEHHYSQLLPATPPQPGQQYAFEVDLDRCSGCKACVTACHSLNGLDEQETWRDVGLLLGGSSTNPVMQHVTTACHHCLEPACMTACPVDAYEKNPVTGIVKHLDDQCFGCQYCTLACPYNVPKYHSARGIVRKCDMCSDRLADGEAPACVQACPHEAISIQLVETEQVIEDSETAHFLPGAPDPQLTLPTTHYKTSRVLPRNTLPADYHSVNPQHPHWPLIIMLVLTQLSVGAFAVGVVFEHLMPSLSLESFRQFHATNALLVGLIALGASTMHLGRPQYAFRAVIGLRHSWLSREIVAFGLFAGTAFAYAAACWLAPDARWLPVLGILVSITGGFGLFCSVMIYVFTKREFWNFLPTFLKFTLTAILLGAAATLASLIGCTLISWEPLFTSSEELAGKSMLRVIIITGTVKLLLEFSLFRHLLFRHETPLKRSARLMIGPLQRSTIARFTLGLLGVVVVPLALLDGWGTEAINSASVIGGALLLFLACICGELLERYQFFSACAAPRMPGPADP